MRRIGINMWTYGGAVLVSSFKNVLKRGYFIESTAALRNARLVKGITIFVFTV